MIIASWLFCGEDYYKRALYSLMCDVIVLKLTTELVQAPGDISTGVDEARQDRSPLQLLFIYTFIQAQLLLRSQHICPALKSNSEDFKNDPKTNSF